MYGLVEVALPVVVDVGIGDVTFKEGIVELGNEFVEVHGEADHVGVDDGVGLGEVREEVHSGYDLGLCYQAEQQQADCLA